MRKFVLICSILLIFIGVTVAQDAEVTPEANNLDTAQLDNAITTTTANLEASNTTLEEMQVIEDRVLNYFGFFETISLVITVLGGVAALTLAIFGFRGFNDIRRARQELDDATLNFSLKEAELDERIRSFDAMKENIQRQIQQDWHNSHLGLSLLPLARQQFRAGNTKGALHTYERAANLDPTNPVTLYHIAYIYTQENELEKAQTLLEKALEIDPTLDLARAALGFVYRRIGEQQTDSQAYERYFELGKQYLNQALVNSERLVDDDGESWYGALAGLHNRLGEIDKAIFYYERASEVTPQSSYPFANLAMLYVQEGNRNFEPAFEKVARLAKEKANIELNDYWGYADLLAAQLALGQANDAETTLEQLLETVPPSVKDVIPRVRDTLQKLGNSLEKFEDYDLNRRVVQIRQVLKQLDAAR